MPTATANMTDEICWCVNELAQIKNQLLSRPFTNLDAGRLFETLIRLAITQIEVIDGKLQQYDSVRQHFAFIAPPVAKPQVFPPGNQAQLPKLRKLITDELNCLLQLRAYQKEQKNLTVASPSPAQQNTPRTPLNILSQALAAGLATNNFKIGAREQTILLCEPAGYSETINDLTYQQSLANNGVRLVKFEGLTFLSFSAMIGHDRVLRPAFAALIFVFPQETYPLIEAQLRDSNNIKTLIAFAREHPLVLRDSKYAAFFEDFFSKVMPQRIQ